MDLVPNTLESAFPKGKVRAAINSGNSALVQRRHGQLTGISPALAQRLAETLGADLETVVYNGAGKVFADAGKGIWDVAFLAIDPKRARRVSFTRPYITIEATFAVRAQSALRALSETDRSGIKLLSSLGSAYELHLSKTLQQASLDRKGTPHESFEAFRNGSWDAVAGVRASLEAAFGGDPDYRLLSGSLTKVEQAMVLPGSDNKAIGALDKFVADALETGFVNSVLKNTASD